MSPLSLFAKKDGAFTINWIIENFTFCAMPKEKFIDSPPYIATTLNKTRWRLRLYPNSVTEDGYISCNLHRMNADNSSSQAIAVDFTISIIGSNGLLLVSGERKRKTFHVPGFSSVCSSSRLDYNTSSINDPSAQTEFSSELFQLIRWDHVLGRKEHYFPNDSLVLKCEIKTVASVPVSSGCTIRTRICVEHVSFTWPIKHFSLLRLNQKMNIDLTFSLEDVPKFSISLQLSGQAINESTIQIAICKIGSKIKCVNYFYSELVVSYSIYLQDSKYIAEGRILFQNNQNDLSFILPDFLKRRNLCAKKDLYLQDDILSLCCKFSITNGKPITNTNAQTKRMPKEMETSYPVAIPKRYKSLDSSEETLMSSIKCLYEQQKHCDLTIEVGSKTFKVHKVILCSRSPVFSKMFEGKMKEGNLNPVKIANFEPETIEMLLHFIYTDELKPDLYYPQAARLYAAGKKYEIGVLAEKCSNILRSSMTVSNVWDILRLGIAFNDEILKKFANIFICSHPGEVFESQAWEDLINKLPLPEV